MDERTQRQVAWIGFGLVCVVVAFLCVLQAFDLVSLPGSDLPKMSRPAQLLLALMVGGFGVICLAAAMPDVVNKAFITMMMLVVLTLGAVYSTWIVLDGSEPVEGMGPITTAVYDLVMVAAWWRWLR